MSIRRKSTRYTVTINGTPASLHFIKGLYEKSGILLPGGGGKTFVATQATTTRTIERTRKVSDRLRRSIVAEFIQAKLPELRPLFGSLTFGVQPVEETEGARPGSSANHPKNQKMEPAQGPSETRRT